MSREKKQITYMVNKKGCWICTSHTPNPGGYPYIGYKGKTVTIARAIMLDKYGNNLPPTVKSLHSCDDKMCINPDHISIGTQKQNMQDAVLRGRRIYMKTEKVERRLISARVPIDTYTDVIRFAKKDKEPLYIFFTKVINRYLLERKTEEEVEQSVNSALQTVSGE